MHADAPVVLVLDDEELIRESLVMYLEASGFAVVGAESGEQALALLTQRSDIDVAIVDIRLPGISGFEFIKRARAGRPALTFLIYTGSTEYGQEADVAGVATKNIFTKPLADLCVLSDAIRRARQPGNG